MIKLMGEADETRVKNDIISLAVSYVDEFSWK